MKFCPCCHRVMCRTYRFNAIGGYVLDTCKFCHFETATKKIIYLKKQGK